MGRKQIRPGAGEIAHGPGVSFSGKSSAPKNMFSRSLGQTVRYVCWPVFNDDRHIVGHELLRIGPDLDRYLRRLAEEAAR